MTLLQTEFHFYDDKFVILSNHRKRYLNNKNAILRHLTKTEWFMHKLPVIDFYWMFFTLLCKSIFQILVMHNSNNCTGLWRDIFGEFWCRFPSGPYWSLKGLNWNVDTGHAITFCNTIMSAIRHYFFFNSTPHVHYFRVPRVMEFQCWPTIWGFRMIMCLSFL